MCSPPFVEQNYDLFLTNYEMIIWTIASYLAKHRGLYEYYQQLFVNEEYTQF
jgi:hypothetical protein